MNRPASRLLPLSLTAISLLTATLVVTAPGLTTYAHATAPLDTAAGASENIDAHTSDVEVVDGAHILSDSDKKMLDERTTGIDFPDSVQRVVYLTFADNDENLNDTVRYFGEDERRDLLDADQKKFAPGTVIVAVGLAPKKMGVYAGDDVAADLDLQDDARLAGITDEMRDPLREKNWALGLLRGAQGAADTEVRSESSEWPGILATGGVLAGGGIACGIGLRSRRKKKAAQAREDYDYILAHHGDIATRLDAIDVRAHSLSSPLADDEFRRQWDDIKAAFLKAQSALDKTGELDRSSTDKEFRAHASALADARAAVEEAVNAEANVEELASLEHGDATARRRALTDLHRDIADARAEAQPREEERLVDIDKRVLALRDGHGDGTDSLTSPDFMDTYTGILTDYHAVIEAVRESMYSDKTVERGDHTAPTLGSSSWHPGMGIYYVPFSVVNNWHSSDVAAASSSNSSSGVTTGYSAGGFAGAGGSSSF